MSFTERELEISNRSYTNKDFAAIYEELLTTAEKLSNRFSPVTAVESDPFIVILKLAAIVADKVNYQIDKNILERFISSCTQRESMVELTETLGYNMHYYRAAETEVVFSYKLSDELKNDIIIPKHTIIENASKIPYITVADSFIDKKSKSSDLVEVIQGKIQTINILGNEKVQLENLNNNNRLYFPELMVAENGIFISEGLSDTWLKVDNLNTLAYGTFAYKFGFDSKKNLPYIEFPDWIADIIGEGLKVDYVVTQGVAGNVAAKELNIIKKWADDSSVNTDDIRVINLSASFSGSDPETLDESYLGFKKIIGTFDTLVTCRDYANAIYNMTSGIDPLVSNVQVADRRTDINYACDVATFDPFLGTVIESVPMKALGKNSEKEGKDKITPFDLVLYPFRPITNTTVSAIQKGKGGYNDSFKFLEEYKTGAITSKLENSGEYLKTLSHTFKQPVAGDILSIQNNYELTATVNTRAKVNALEQADIISNIYSALAKEFNARKLNFGHEISFNELLNVMEAADARISSIMLQEPIQVPKIITRAETSSSYSEVINDVAAGDADSEPFKFIVAKNVLGGRVSLYEYDDDFEYSYDYGTIEKIPNVTKITTKCKIDAIAAEDDYTLKNNEVVQFLAPNLVTENIYTAGIYYHLELSSGERISEDTDYQLQQGDVLKFCYKKDGILKTDTIEVGKIISSKTELFTTQHLKETDGRTVDKTHLGDDYYALLSGEEVTIKDINSEEVKTGKKAYWITSAEDNKINWSSDNDYILQENEYFFYSDINLTTLFAFGSGTRLTINSEMQTWDWTCKEDININDITLEGLYALKDSFKTVSFDNENKLEIVENEIVTLTASDSIQNVSDSSSFTITDNTFTPIGNSIKLEYKHLNETDFRPLPDKSNITGGNWSARSLLDINCGPSLEQDLVGNQEVTYITSDNNSGTLLKAYTKDILKFNVLVQRGGGVDIDLGYITINNLEQESYPTLLKIKKETDNKIKKTADGMFVPDFNGSNDAKFYASPAGSIVPYIMIFVKDAGSTLPSISAYNASDGGISGSSKELKEGLNIIKLAASDVKYWKLSKGDGNNIEFTISPLKYVKGINPLLGLQATNLDDFETYLKNNFTAQYEKFYSISELDPVKAIELSKDYPLSHAQAFYDSNNIANKWVLPKIDFTVDSSNRDNNKIKIVIARSSTK